MHALGYFIGNVAFELGASFDFPIKRCSGIKVNGLIVFLSSYISQGELYGTTDVLLLAADILSGDVQVQIFIA